MTCGAYVLLDADNTVLYVGASTNIERRLRELASDNADAVERGDMTADEANALYVRTADRLMHDS